MLSYFRQNDPFRVLGLFALILVTRIFLFVAVDIDVAMDSELAEGINGYFSGYEGPLYTVLQLGLSSVLTNVTLNVILASIIVLINATLLNSILIRNSAFEENTYIPSAIYIMLMAFHKGNYLLSKELLGSTFILLSLSYLHQHIRFRNSEEKVLSTGSTIALASLFFLPYGWFLILALILFLFYSGTTGRRYLLLIWGFVLILGSSWLVFLFLNEGNFFWSGYIDGLTFFEFNESLVINIAICLGFPFLLSLIASTTNLAGMGMTNLQINVKRVFSWIGLFGVFGLLFQSRGSGTSSAILIIALSYFLTEYLLGLKRKWLAEAVFTCIMVLMLAMLYFYPIY